MTSVGQLHEDLVQLAEGAAALFKPEMDVRITILCRPTKAVGDSSTVVSDDDIRLAIAELKKRYPEAAGC